jgi:hypothetical protein
LAPVFDKDDKATEVTEIVLPKPLAENASYSVVLPRELQDNAGRPLANAASFPLKVATGSAPPIAKFAAAPFGVIERNADAMLPVTLRHVQADLRGGDAAASAPAATSAGRVRVKRLQSDADILAWYAKLQKYHETQLTGRGARPAEEPMVHHRGRRRRQGPADQAQGRAPGRHARGLAARQRRRREAARPAAARRRRPAAVRGGGPAARRAGYHVVEIESLRLGQALLDKRAPMYVRTGVLVTNLGVHFKLGRENSVVWVTTLDRGKPVAGADIAVNDCTGKPLWTGRSDAKGLAVVARALDAGFDNCPADSGYFVTARKADEKGGATDVAFVFSSWQKGIESWRFNVPTGRGAEPDLRAATVFDRTLFRAGETVSMKHFIRTETAAGLAVVPAAKLPTTVKLVHQGSGRSSASRCSGAAAAAAPAPPGTFRPRPSSGSTRSRSNGLTRPMRSDVPAGEGEARQRSWASGNFRVEEFRLPLVDARLSGPKAVQVAPASVAVDVQMSYFSGGPMGGAPLRASALLKSRSPGFAGYDEFSFEPPRDPKKAEQEGSESEEGDGPARDGKLVADKLPLTTDRNGAAAFTLKDLPPVVRPSQIDAEVSFADPNGETQTVAARIDLWPSAVVLGVRAASWASNRGRAKFTVLALDTAGKPIKGQSVAVKGRVSQIISTRKRMVGGFYAYDNRTEVKELGSLCSGTTDDRGLLLCEATLDAAGQVELIAEANDAASHPATAAATVWITKQGEVWFAQDNDDRIDVLPEKKRYEPGETARLQVRMPFREATALVAVEREGVIATQVATLRGDDPTVELKVEPGWGPNVYVSVLALRGRIRETPWYSFFTWGWKEPLEWWRSFRGDGKDWQAPTAMIDLAKPAFKLGVAKLQVGLAAHELQVSVTADKPQYAVRQTAMAKIRVTQGGKPMAGAQVAFAAVDEGLLALRGNDSWNLLEAMIRERAWGVETSTAQSEIIGRRHYGRKAVAAGGGGGRGSARELFDTLLIWKANIVVDANGEATVAVPINDSLTSFRLVAIADAEVQKFGTGSTSVRVTQDLQVLAGLPPLVRDGDQFSAMLTLRNTTPREMKGAGDTAGHGQPAGGRRRQRARACADRPAAAGRGACSGYGEGSGLGRSACRPRRSASPGRPRPRRAAPRTGSSSPSSSPRRCRCGCCRRRWPSSTAATPCRSPAPADAVARRRAARRLDAERRPRCGAALPSRCSPKLSGALPGMRRFFETYPFACLEQKASKAVGLKDAKLWAGVANTLPDLPRQRRPRRLLPAALRRCARRQRPAHGVRAGGDARGRLRVAGGGARRDARGARRLRRRPDRAQGLVAAARPRREEARGDRGAVALRPGAGEDARLDRHDAECLADRCLDRLAQHPEARRRHSRPGEAPGGSEPGPARPAHLQRHDPEVQHRGERLLVVADG